MSTFEGRHHFPVPGGAFSVGCLDLADRHVFMRLFYPHKLHVREEDKLDYLRGKAHRWAKWFPEREYATGYVSFKYSKLLPEWTGSLLTWFTHDPYSTVIENGDLSEDDESSSFPVVVFSHGNGGFRTTYSSLCAEMASRGFLVAALEHSDGSASRARRLAIGAKDASTLTEWTEGPVSIPGNDQEDYVIRNKQVTVRANECSQAVTVLSRLNEGDLEGIVKPFDDQERPFHLRTFRGRMALDKGVILAGHSFGGATVVKAMSDPHIRRPDFSAGFCLDAWMYPLRKEVASLAAADGGRTLAFLNYEDFQWRKNLEAMRHFEQKLQFGGQTADDESTVDINVHTVRGATHYSASDIPAVFAGTYLRFPLAVMAWVGRMLGRGGSNLADEDDTKLGPQQSLEISVDLFTAFLKSLGLTPRLLANDNCDSFSRRLRKHQRYLIAGTRYKDESNS